ncbi:xanthine dehydrogenase molybdopterin binding subunit [Elstera cyanobacteriorum]|uniref:Xanthine dehydrogenase molybdopterin binding subunit n=1 Tax=Elstera cyanobacteriorum TaxID=2022747 RepID=A0A255XT90_9PROT|nr:xanthine dehydrogenase molybdopterin binding subunit [Elstera cyanobacteriorum]OYQ20133.1 xanthine dehydrogenase molybdopterin binding subunit [Elstera cyanobacteriorum]GFZ81538.1 xanthine dehydrogenase molybdopterin binding subunit [Elstera cyanobacteriorum]
MKDGAISPTPAVGAALPHDAARRHVRGTAPYIDDLPEPAGLLHAAVGLSPVAHGTLTGLDLDKVRAYTGVVAVLSAADIPGENNVGPVLKDDPILVDRAIEFHGQALFAVAADTLHAARRAARLDVATIDPLPALLTIDEALAANSHILPPQRMARGDAAGAIAKAAHRLTGSLTMGGQDHFYLEGQISLAIPTEDGGVLIYCSTQHPSEVQHLVAHALHLPDALVTVEVRRLGGGFGGKETQAAQFAALAAIFALKTKRPVKLRLDRDDDMVMTGKRHDFQVRYTVGFDEDGRIEGLDALLASRCGYSADLSGAINDRALFHIDNCYYLPHVSVESLRLKTHTVSNTAFRGFGGPQGMLAIEAVIDDIARFLGKDPQAVRAVNLYGPGRDIAPYGQVVDDDIAPRLIARLAESADYAERRAAIDRFNAASPYRKRGLALTPVKFGISFTTTFLNQAGALVHVYTDGSVQVNHGGIEMGQGLYQKIRQVTADCFGIDIDKVLATATTTGKVPNTSATAASSGADMNGKAAEAAALQIRTRLAAFAAQKFGVTAADISFNNGQVSGGGQSLPFPDLVRAAYLARISLSSTGFYATPKIHFDKETFTGRPFLYYAYGAAVAEVEVDCLTGENKLLRVDILHDCGASLNPALDKGQIEGGFIQGMGWLTMEELVWDATGRLRTHAPSTYKIPAISDTPEAFTVTLWDEANREETIHRSKAVGEPPLMLANAVFFALRDAVAATAALPGPVPLDAPATPERLLRAIQTLSGSA